MFISGTVVRGVVSIAFLMDDAYIFSRFWERASMTFRRNLVIGYRCGFRNLSHKTTSFTLLSAKIDVRLSEGKVQAAIVFKHSLCDN